MRTCAILHPLHLELETANYKKRDKEDHLLFQKLNGSYHDSLVTFGWAVVSTPLQSTASINYKRGRPMRGN
jgi:hypothetical protein